MAASATEALRFVSEDKGLRERLEVERQRAYKYLGSTIDLVSIHRAQGRLNLVEELLADLDTARNSR